MGDGYGRDWIIEHAVPIVQSGDFGGTLRSLHYRLVSQGMPNTMRHYKRLIAAMGHARWEGILDFGDFDDHEREVLGETKAEETDVEAAIDEAVSAIETWMDFFSKNRWENQPKYVEVWIEKKALQGVFRDPCRSNRVALCPCKGYPSLTYLAEAVYRFQQAEGRGQKVVILYFGDYDPSGEDIPRSIQETLWRMGADVEVKRILLLEDQVVEWGLPPAPTKSTDTRSYRWSGLGQVELDAIQPSKLREICQDAIAAEFDDDLYDELQKQEDEEEERYKDAVFEKVKSMMDRKQTERDEEEDEDEEEDGE